MPVSESDIDPLALEILEEVTPDIRSKSGVWENEDLAQVKYKVLRGHHEGINSVQFCLNDTHIVTSSDDKTCVLWSMETGEKVQVFEDHGSIVSECHMSPDNTKLVSACWDKHVRVWDVETGKILWQGTHGGIVTCSQISHDGKYVVSVSDLDNVVAVRSIQDGSLVSSVNDLHKSTITCCRFSPDDNRLCTTSMDKTIKLWDRNSKKVTLQLEGHINIVSCCCFSRDERQLCTGAWDKILQVWDVSTGMFRSEGPRTFNKGHEGSVSACCFSPEGTLLFSGSYDRTVVVWDANNGGLKLTLKGHQDWVTGLDVSQDSNWVLSSSRDKTVRLWHIGDSDKIPVVMENKMNMGLKIIKCDECGKPFSITQLENVRETHMCVFCRMQASRPLPSFEDVEEFP
ncbi:WD repeat-containing protein 88-like [Lytechinus variegatus]|uniref:WD repeat-containing protein 88-like n=1 Tax=Lytechinus variegatus TaxID=7654 RepID=UPI001BB0F47F|nr:WD repeat-containing protein 88-like [Lytechinus variegatus]